MLLLLIETSSLAIGPIILASGYSKVISEIQMCCMRSCLSTLQIGVVVPVFECCKTKIVTMVVQLSMFVEVISLKARMHVPGGRLLHWELQFLASARRPLLHMGIAVLSRCRLTSSMLYNNCL